MSQSDDDSSERFESTGRRRFLKLAGALGAVGLAGCGGDGGTDTPTPGPTETGPETTSTPGPTDTDPMDTPEPIDTDPMDTPEPTDTDPMDTPEPTDTPSETPTPTETGTPCQGSLGDDPATLFSFTDGGGAISGGETATITGELLNPYLFALDTGSVSLAPPNDDWSVTAVSGTNFDGLASQGTQTVEWEVTAPDDASGSFDLTVEETYTRCDDEAQNSVSTSVIVISGDVTSPITDGLIAQFDATQLSDGAVSSWPDVSGSGAVLSQSDSGAQPSLEADASPTGQPAVSFDADAGEFLSTDEPLTTATGGVTMSVSFRLEDPTVPRQVLAFNGNDANMNGYGITVNQEGETNGTVRGLYGGVSWFPSGTTITDSDWHVVTMVIPDDGVGPGLFLDGEELQLSAQNPGSSPSAPTDQFGIAQDRSTQEDPPYLQGAVGEELVYERALPGAERAQIETYLTNRWIAGSE